MLRYVSGCRLENLGGMRFEKRMVEDSVDATDYRMGFCSFIELASIDEEDRDCQYRLTDGYIHHLGLFAVMSSRRSDHYNAVVTTVR